MKVKHIAILFILTISLSTHLVGQQLISGDLSFLKEEKILNTEFIYDSLAVGLFATEAEYIQKKVSEHNTAVPGKGDDWLSEWNYNKENVYPDAFIKAFNKRLKKKGLVAGLKQIPAKYTMVVRTTFFEGGFAGYAFVTGPSNVNTEIIFYNSGDREHEVARISSGLIYGNGGFPETAYNHTGVVVASFLIDTVFK